MSIKKYFATKDNSINNKFTDTSYSLRSTGSNIGAADVLEVYSYYNRDTNGSAEIGRTLVQFPVSQISADRTAGIIPASGSVTFKFKLYNARHFYSLPYGYDMEVAALSASWEEGIGLDAATYADLTRNVSGSNWMNANNSFASASATIKIINGTPGGGSGLDDGSPPSFTLTSTDGTERTYAFQNGGSYANGASAGGTTVRWYGTTGDATTQGGIAALLQTAIEGSAGHNGKLAVTLSTDTNTNDTLTVTQKETGYAGNTSIPAITNGNASDVTINGGIVKTSFDGGAGQWTRPGGDFYTDSSSSFTQRIKNGPEDIDIDITPLVEQWIGSLVGGSAGGNKKNYGLVVKLHGNHEPLFDTGTGKDEVDSNGAKTGALLNTTGSKKSYFTKMFFARGTEHYFKRPAIEAQFDNSIKDDRNRFYISSSVKENFSDNFNRLYFYNSHNGHLVDIKGATNQFPTVSLYYSSGSVPEGSKRGFLVGPAGSDAVTSKQAARHSKGIYYVDMAVTGGIVNSTYPYLVDVWSFGNEELLTGSAITPIKTNFNYLAVNNNYVISMPNLLPEYRNDQSARLRLYARKKNWSPNIYSVAKSKPESYIIASGSYRVLRAVDDYEVLAYGTGSVKYSEMSYDADGNYFDLDMSNYEPGYQYFIKFAFYDEYTKKYQEQPYKFKFRVVE